MAGLAALSALDKVRLLGRLIAVDDGSDARTEGAATTVGSSAGGLRRKKENGFRNLLQPMHVPPN